MGEKSESQADKNANENEPIERCTCCRDDNGGLSRVLQQFLADHISLCLLERREKHNLVLYINIMDSERIYNNAFIDELLGVMLL